MDAQRQIEHWNVREHAVIAERLVADPEGVTAHARRNLERWASRYDTVPVWMREWQKALSGPVEDLVRLLHDRSEHAVWLRSCSPFAGVLTARERWAIRRRPA
jgi:hypothetical protein